MYDELISDLKRDEGWRAKPYRDTVGKLTIGYGRNLDDIGLRPYEGDLMLRNDALAAMDELDRNVPWWRGLPDNAMRGLVNMCFNMGWPRLSKFRRMLGALESRDYLGAADEALNSKWARQVGARSQRIAALFRGCHKGD